MELMKRGAMMTVLKTLLTALALPATLLSMTDFIDSKWAIAVDRFFFVCVSVQYNLFFELGVGIKEEKVMKLFYLPFVYMI